MTLSPLMQAALLYLLASERGGSQGVCATRTALALHRRGLVLARFNRERGYDCDLTDKGREVALSL